MATRVLDLAAAWRWAVTSRSLLLAARERIDALNVFPVPDGDTGTNLVATIEGALELVRSQQEVGGAAPRLDEGLALLARGMLLSARGNSGVILSQLARGMAEAVAGPGVAVDAVGPHALAEAFERAADVAWSGVSRPVEGTMLSVADAAAAGARAAADRGPGIGTYGVALAALGSAREALARTPEQLPRLALAGVVDAGGAGLVLVIEALETVLSERPFDPIGVLPEGWDQRPTRPRTARSDSPPDLALACAEGEGSHEVMYLLTDSDPERAHHLRAQLLRIGSSVMVVGGPRDWRVHVHLDDPPAAVEAGSLSGRVEDVTTSSLSVPGSPAPQPRAGATVSRVGVVACAPGEGLAAMLVGAGAEVVHSSARRRASTGQLLSAVRAVAADHVVLLPNDPDTVLAAEAAAHSAGEEGLSVRVLPTRAVVQALAAMAVCDPNGEIDQVVVDMADAAAAVSYGAITRAETPGSTPAGPCRRGQWLGLLGAEIAVVHDDLPQAARQLLGLLADVLPGEPEVLTVVAGVGADRHGIDVALRSWKRRHRDVEVHRVDGGQPTFPFLLGLE